MAIVSLATLSIYSLGRHHGEAIGENAANTDTYARHTEEDIEKCLALPEDGSKSKCIREVIEANNEHERMEDDLVAQTEMALWALGMLVVTFLGVLATGAGVYYVRRTLIQADKTNIAALGAANAANEANAMMRLEKRPWVALIHEVACDVHFGKDSFRFTWNYNFENKGLSPAYDVVLEWKPIRKDWRKSIEDLAQEFSNEAISRRGYSQSPVLFPGETTNLRRFKHVGVVNYLDGTGYIQEAEALLLVCISYRLGLGSNEMGVETRVFAFETRDQPLGPFTARMLEYSFARYIK
ncbi:hypothetical protein [Roseovarius aestuarii]|uniref:hypothetical protein n=1 Tax=Roseovarius aestuarii TaxID=475083 RepID=UPI00366C4036